jgi:hypothetical protein
VIASKPVLPAKEARELPPATVARLAPQTPAEARKNTPANTIRRVREPEFVRAVDCWLAGGPWACADAAFRPYHGINVRLTERGDSLLENGVPVVSRHPTVLNELPTRTRTSNRLEAHALAAVAVRGDAGMYGPEADRRSRSSGLTPP